METATSWEMVAHEAGHAVEHGLKPNLYLCRPRVQLLGRVVRRPDGDVDLIAESGAQCRDSWPKQKATSIIRIRSAAWWRRLLYWWEGTGIRDAFQDLKVSDTERRGA